MRIKNILLFRIAPWLGVKNYHPREKIFPFSFAYTATLLSRQGYNVKILDTAIEKIDCKSIAECNESENPDLLVIETLSSTMHIAEDIIEAMKRILGNRIVVVVRDIGIRVGKEYLKAELECFLPHILKKFPEWGSSQELACFIQGAKRWIVEDLDSLGHIDYRFFNMNKYFKSSVCPPFFRRKRWGFVLSGRGCPGQCTFCSPALRHSIGSVYRTHSPARVVNEIKRLMKDYKVNAVSFEDDNFILDKNHVEQICDSLMKERINIYWTAQARVDLLDKDILRIMKKAGCFALGVGVESGSNRILNRLNKRQSVEKAQETISIMKKIGIMPLLYFIIGNPTETLEEMEATFRFASRLGACMIQVHYLTPYPGSKIFESFKKKKVSFENFSHYDSVPFNFSAIPDNILQNSLKRFYLRYYLSFGFLCRYLRYRFPFTLSDSMEIKLVLNSLRFLFKRQ